MNNVLNTFSVHCATTAKMGMIERLNRTVTERLEAKKTKIPQNGNSALALGEQPQRPTKLFRLKR